MIVRVSRRPALAATRRWSTSGTGSRCAIRAAPHAAPDHHVRYTLDAADQHTEHLEQVAHVALGSKGALVVRLGVRCSQPGVYHAKPRCIPWVLRWNMTQQQEAHVPARRCRARGRRIP